MSLLSSRTDATPIKLLYVEGGTIGIASALGQGTTVTITLPNPSPATLERAVD